MFLVEISNPCNEKECKYFTISGAHPKGELLREAMLAVGRRYVINFYPTHVYILMDDIAKKAQKVTVGELLCIYSKIKFYKEVERTEAFTETVNLIRTFTYPKDQINVEISSVPGRCFIKMSTPTFYTRVNEERFIMHLNDQLNTSFKMGNVVYHYPLDTDEHITIDKEHGLIIREYTKVVTAYKTTVHKELI